MTLASAGWALRHLLEIGVLSPADVLGGLPEAEDVSVSHTAYRVTLGQVPRWFVKRANTERTLGRTLGEEATVYRMASEHAALAALLPRCESISPDKQVIVLEALDALVMHPTHDGLRAYGAAVAHVHDVMASPFGTTPWLVTALEARWGDYAWLSPAGARLLHRLRATPVARDGFATARREWRSGRLVHGDLRWANVLQSSGSGRVWLVDWELACSGDPAWDVGSMLADALATAVTADSAGDPWDTVWAQWRDVVAGYHAVARPSEPAWRHLMTRSVRLSAIRLVQTIMEYGHESDDVLDQAAALLEPWTLFLLQDARRIGHELASNGVA